MTLPSSSYRFWVFAWLALYVATLTVAYQMTMDAGLTTLDMYGYGLDYSKCVWVFIGIVWLSFLLPIGVNKPSGGFVWIITVFLIVPSLVGFIFSAVTLKMISMACVLLLVVILVSTQTYSLHGAYRRLPLNPNVLAWGGVSGSVVLISLSFDYSAINFFVDSVHINRRLISKNQFELFEYVHPVVTKSLLPFVLIYALHTKKFKSMAIAFMCAILIFFLVQHRVALACPFFVLSGYILYKRYASIFGLVICSSLTVMLFTMIVLLYLGDTYSNVPDFVIRRSLMVPSILQSVYIEYFSQSVFTYYSDSKITFGLVSYPYEMPVPYLIGEYIGLPGAHANAGIIGAGYQQAGIIGVAIYVTILSAFVFVVDLLSPQEWKPVTFAVCLPGFLTMVCSSDLPAVFLTHGLILATLLIFLLKYGRKESVRFEELMP